MKQADAVQKKAEGSSGSSETEGKDGTGEKKEKEPMAAPEQPASAMQKDKKPSQSAPEVQRRVLFPTQSTWDYDLLRLSMTPVHDASRRESRAPAMSSVDGATPCSLRQTGERIALDGVAGNGIRRPRR